ncbi:hypothetical protein PA27867_3593 [Cryobacterium arcticum]|uniref:Uncharacterized protein n=1 Tax=Cryobacterium arcticum TaxID=670052 RepID=A0A1B1BPD8_9MICO|nr:hypothetical protein PA27867_3593 [Cryobacterium arcticum]
MQISINVPDAQYRLLLAHAKTRHVETHHLIEQLVSKALTPSQQSLRDQLRHNIRQLHSTGRTDRQIAEALDEKRSRVSYHRADMQLRSHDPRGRKPLPKASK